MQKPSASTLPEIEGYRVDLPALLQLWHAYDAEKCSACGCCCSSYEVTVPRRELSRLTGMIPAASRHAPGLQTDGEYENPFERVEKGVYAIDTDEEGLCVFAYRDPAGQVRCSIHTAALEQGLDPYKTKPSACTLWPLALTEDTLPTLTVQEDAYRFPCNRRRRNARHLAPEVAATIRTVFGASFLDAVQAAISGR